MATIYDKGIAYKNFNGDIWYRNFPNNSGTATEPLPGGAGWGCGVYPGDDLEDTLGLIPMEGCDNPNSDNYGNYQNADGSVFCFIPKYYYSFDCKPTDTHYQDVLTYSKLTAEQVAEIVNRSPNNYFVIAPGSAFTNEEEANAHGFILHRAFIDGDVEKSGFFIMKYIASKGTDGTSNKALSVKNGIIISLTNISGPNNSSDMPSCSGNLKDAIILSKAINSNFNCASGFMYSALALQSKFLGTIAKSTEQCAWYDPFLITNFPKGCNNNDSEDIDDSTVKYIIDSIVIPYGIDYITIKKAKTGSGAPFNKTTHNGQVNGVSDLNGCIYQVVTGVGWAGSRILKDSVKLSDITVDNVNNQSASIYDTATAYKDSPFYWGNGNPHASWRKAVNGTSRALEGIYPVNAPQGCSDMGMNEFGKDYCGADDSYSVLLCSGRAIDGDDTGIFYRKYANWLDSDLVIFGFSGGCSFRAGGYAS